MPPKGTSSLPLAMPKQPRPKPVTKTVTSPSPKRDRLNTTNKIGRTDRSPSLQAYISAPPPKVSPPLRSSRPRQTVSGAHPSQQRNRITDRVSSFQNNGQHAGRNGATPAGEGAREPRLKPRNKPPELGTVDFAARRQRIQQAFNESMQQRRKDELLAAERRRMAKDKADKDKAAKIAAQQVQQQEEAEEQRRQAEQGAAGGYASAAEIEKQTATLEADSQPQQPQLNNEEEKGPIGTTPERVDIRLTVTVPDEDTDRFLTPPEEPSPLETQDSSPPGTTSTELLLAASDPAASIDGADSPTLGVADDQNDTTLQPRRYNPETELTPAPNDYNGESDGTMIENEPQAVSGSQHGLPKLSDHRAMLSKIMHMRTPSASDIDSNEVRDGDDTDDQGSIQVMIRRSQLEAATLERQSDHTDQRPSLEMSATSHPGRWSYSSWASSGPERPSLEGPMEPIEERSPPRANISEILPRRRSRPSNAAVPSMTARSTMDSGIDMAIGRVMDETAAGGQLNENVLRTFQQQIQAQSPELARLGGWDSKQLTKLYLQELAREKERDRISHSSAMPRPLNLHLAQQGIVGPPKLTPDFDDSESYQTGASLNRLDDWVSASPSVADWMHYAAADDRTSTESVDAASESPPPPPPPKDGSSETGEVDGEMSLPPIQVANDGLGLAIDNMFSTERRESEESLSEIPPPPLPNHSPPPIPQSDSQQSLDAAIMLDKDLAAEAQNELRAVSIDSGLPVPSGQDSKASSMTKTSIIVHPPVIEHPAMDASPTTKPKTPTPDQKRLTKRRHIIKELLDTEQTFGRDMKVVDDIYKGTSSSCLDLSGDDVKVLFGNSDQIVQFSMSFLDGLKQAAKPVYVIPRSQRWLGKHGSRSTSRSGRDDQSSMHGDLTDDERDRLTFIGEMFVESLGKMEKVYAEYLKNHESATKKLFALQQNPNVGIWLRECRSWASDLTSAWDLDSLLVKPVQRLLKYPLLVAQLLESTPADHPDHQALEKSLRELTEMSVRINESKKRADLVEQVVGNRKRKESDVRSGFSKAFGRRTEKLKQQVGLSEVFEDKEYDELHQRFQESFAQVQIVMRDVEMYAGEAQVGMQKWMDFVLAIEGFMEVAQSSHPEMESKWKRFRMSVKEVMNTALPEHIATVRKSVIEPMLTLIKLHDGPQKVMYKRNKRLIDHARFKAAAERGDKSDKKTTEQSEQFVALNVTLKEELPRLFSLTGKLMEACLDNFVQIQANWQSLLQKKFGYVLERFPLELSDIYSEWSGDFQLTEAQALSLGICNGSLLAETVNLVNFVTPPSEAYSMSSVKWPGVNAVSIHSNASTRNSQDSASMKRHSGGFVTSPMADNASQYSANSGKFNRGRSSSATTGSNIRPPMAMAESNGNGFRSMLGGSRSRTSLGAAENPTVKMVPRLNTESSPSIPHLALETPTLGSLNPESPSFLTPSIFSPPMQQSASEGGASGVASPASETQRFSNFFSSAMPMSDTPVTTTPGPNALSDGLAPTGNAFAATNSDVPASAANPAMAMAPSSSNATRSSTPRAPDVLFTAASLYEFNIDRARREAGYPYLTYVAGEIFDVVAEKGELWLARNQDDSTGLVGWIWCKHFGRLVE